MSTSEHSARAMKYSGEGEQARIVLQQCQAARLQVDEDAFVEIRQGVVVYVTFLRRATPDTLDKMVKAVLGVKLSRPYPMEPRTFVSILELPGDVLIVPQSTLGAVLKKKRMTYHHNHDKDLGRDLYNDFVELCSKTVAEHPLGGVKGCQVKSGTYGNKFENFMLRTDTWGPYTHILEF